MRIFMTGSTGFAGSHLANRLLSQGHQVYGLVHWDSGHQPVPDHKLFIPVAGDLLDPANLRQQISHVKPDVIYHLAGQASPSMSWTDPILTISLNLTGTVNILEAARQCGTPRIVNVTSALLYGEISEAQLPITEASLPAPTHPYGVSKWAASQMGRLYWQRYRLPVIEARPFNHVGPNQALGFVVPDFAKQIAGIKLGRKEPEMTVGNLAAARDFTDVRDVVRAYEKLAETGEPGETYLVCSGRAVSIQSILDLFLEIADLKFEISINVDKKLSRSSTKIFGSYRKLNRATKWDPMISLRHSLSDALEEWLQYWMDG